MPKYVCPKCGHELNIGLMVSVGGDSNPKCPKCGEETKEK